MFVLCHGWDGDVQKKEKGMRFLIPGGQNQMGRESREVWKPGMEKVIGWFIKFKEDFGLRIPWTA